MNDRKQGSDHKREYGYRFGAPRDGPAPFGSRHAQYCRDQSARVRYAYPENKIGYVERPHHGPVETPHAYAARELKAESCDGRKQQSAAYGDRDVPPAPRLHHGLKQFAIDLCVRRSGDLHMDRMASYLSGIYQSPLFK